MPEVGYRFRIASDVPVVAAPAEIEALAQRPRVREQGPVTDTRACEQCGRVFVPQREHALTGANAASTTMISTGTGP